MWDAAEKRLNDFDNIVTVSPDNGEMREISSAFVPSKVRADALGALALAYYALRLSYTSDYRGDPSIKAGDVVEIENDYESRGALIMEHRITWSEADKLNGSVKGMGET